MELKFEKREKIAAPSRNAAAIPKTVFINSLRRQGLAYKQLVQEGKEKAVDNKGKTIRQLWGIDPSDGKMVFWLRYGVRELFIDGGNSIPLKDEKQVPDCILSLIEAAQEGTFDKDLQKSADAIKADRAAAKAKKA